MHLHITPKKAGSKAFLILSFMAGTLFSTAQNVAINNSGIKADASAMLDISSDSKGILIPRLTSVQRAAMQWPANGLLVFDSSSNSFWYFAGGWKEITTTSAQALIPELVGAVPSGAAGGDLSGNYPNPGVAKIQTLEVATGKPLDKQIMKWDTSKNRWQGLNDSLFLPYNVSFASATKLFGITNTNVAIGSSAVYGKSGATASGISPISTAGVWGDNLAGAGVLGTSNTGQGVYGSSLKGIGVAGYSTGADGVGILGEAGQANSLSKAAIFRNVNSKNDKTVVEIINSGTGNGLYAFNSNAANTSAMLRLRNGGQGKYISIEDANYSERFSLAKNGDIQTVGTLTVKGDKGIVRNSTGTQLRTEILQANLTIPVSGKLELDKEASFTINVFFSTPFAVPPAVYIGNIVKTVAYATYMNVAVTDVTTTGCKFTIVNTLSHAVIIQNTGWKLIAVGAE